MFKYAVSPTSAGPADIHIAGVTALTVRVLSYISRGRMFEYNGSRDAPDLMTEQDFDAAFAVKVITPTGRTTSTTVHVRPLFSSPPASDSPSKRHDI